MLLAGKGEGTQTHPVPSQSGLFLYLPRCVPKALELSGGGNSCSHLCGRCLGWDPMYRGHPMGTGRFGVFSLASFLRCLGGNSSLSPADFCGCKLGPRVVVCLCFRHTWLLRAQSPHGSEPQGKPDAGLDPWGWCGNFPFLGPRSSCVPALPGAAYQLCRSLCSPNNP